MTPYVHLSKFEVDALRFFRSKRRSVFELCCYLKINNVSAYSLVGKLMRKGLLTREFIELRGGFHDGVKRPVFTTKIGEEKASHFLGLSVLQDALGCHVKPTYMWLRSWMPKKQATRLMRKSGLWKSRNHPLEQPRRP